MLVGSNGIVGTDERPTTHCPQDCTAACSSPVVAPERILVESGRVEHLPNSVPNEVESKDYEEDQQAGKRRIPPCGE